MVLRDNMLVRNRVTIVYYTSAYCIVQHGFVHYIIKIQKTPSNTIEVGHRRKYLA